MFSRPAILLDVDGPLNPFMAITERSLRPPTLPPVAVVAIGAKRKAYLAAEYVLVFFGLTLVYDLLARGSSPIPVLLVLGGASVTYLLRTSTFDRKSLWRASEVRGQLRSILTLWALTAVAAVIAVAALFPASCSRSRKNNHCCGWR